MRSFSGVLLATLPLVLAAGSASAQTREGFFIGIGTGMAWGSAQATGLSKTADDGTWTVPIRLGWKLSDRALLGAETGLWDETHDDGYVSVSNWGLALYYYPAAKGPFLKGGVGVSHANVARGQGYGASGTGLSVMLGAGYDLPIGAKVAVTPVATFRYGGPDTLTPRDGGDLVRGFRHSVIEVGVGFSFY